MHAISTTLVVYSHLVIPSHVLAHSYSLSFVVYVLRMLFFGLALLIAARPDLDNPGCYRNGWDYFRGVCEGISLLFFLFILGREIRKMFRCVCGCMTLNPRVFVEV